jgi:hypothetical protein
MAKPLTYGQLTDQARRLAAAAAAQPLPVALPPDRAALDATALTMLVTVAARHAHFLARPFHGNHPAGQLARHLTLAATAASQALPDAQPAMSNPWCRAADLLAIAHDLLTSQIGPAGEHRGPDAWLLASPSAVDAATGRLATLTLTAAISAHELAARTLQHPTSVNSP